MDGRAPPVAPPPLGQAILFRHCFVRHAIPWGPNSMKNTVLVAFVFVLISWPLLAATHHARKHDRRTYHHGVTEIHSQITCEMVRSYVAQVGVEQARTMAKANGMTSSEEQTARRCLAHQ